MKRFLLSLVCLTFVQSGAIRAQSSDSAPQANLKPEPAPLPPAPNPPIQTPPASPSSGAASQPPQTEVSKEGMMGKGSERRKKEKKKLPSLGSTRNAKIPGQPWSIHDSRRPRPRPVLPGSTDSLPPQDAIVLFDGTDLSQWCHRGTDDELFEPMWRVENGYFEIEPHTGSIFTIDSFGSCQLHLEWHIPVRTQGNGQGRGNSGVKLMERYEVQILDSFKQRTYADGQAGAIYGQMPPQVNASRPQGQWQTYDIFFEAPVFEQGELIRRPHVTVIHNGILIHHHQEILGATGLNPGNRDAAVLPAAPIMLQDHSNPIRFRNIWIRELEEPR